MSEVDDLRALHIAAIARFSSPALKRKQAQAL